MKIGIMLFDPANIKQLALYNLDEIYDLFGSRENEISLLTPASEPVEIDLLILPESQGLDTTGRGFTKYALPPDYPSPSQGFKFFFDLKLELWRKQRLLILAIGNSALEAWKQTGLPFDYSNGTITPYLSASSSKAYSHLQGHEFAYSIGDGTPCPILAVSSLSVVADGADIKDLISTTRPPERGPAEPVEV